MNFSNKETEAAATIIQRSFRYYLCKRNNGEFYNNVDEKCAYVDENQNRIDVPAVEIKEWETSSVLQTVKMLWEKWYSHLRKKEEIRNLCEDIDKIAENLKEITKLDQCKEIQDYNSCSSCLRDDVKKVHEKRMMAQVELKWWEKLDLEE